jgi:hypothetical protein
LRALSEGVWNAEELERKALVLHFCFSPQSVVYDNKLTLLYIASIQLCRRLMIIGVIQASANLFCNLAPADSLTFILAAQKPRSAAVLYFL